MEKTPEVPYGNLTLNDKMDFGKYKGKDIAQVACKDPQYLMWAEVNRERFSMNKEARLYTWKKYKENNIIESNNMMNKDSGWVNC
jgi:uncharacterized protein (DUF3820 family)